jgi:hypothetical protein
LKLGPTVKRITAEKAMVEGTMIVLVTPVLGVITRSTSVNVVIKVMLDSTSVPLATTTNPSVFVPVITSVSHPLLQRKDGVDGRLQQAREKVFL